MDINASFDTEDVVNVYRLQSQKSQNFELEGVKSTRNRKIIENKIK